MGTHYSLTWLIADHTAHLLERHNDTARCCHLHPHWEALHRVTGAPRWDSLKRAISNFGGVPTLHA